MTWAIEQAFDGRWPAEARAAWLAAYSLFGATMRERVAVGGDESRALTIGS